MQQKVNNVKQFKLDKHDEKIITELLNNAKTPLRTLAKKLSLSFVTVMNRIKRLEQAGIIEYYTAKINYDLLGYDITVIIEIRISKGKLFDLEKKIARSSNISAVYDTTGDFDTTVIGRFKTTRQMDNFLKKIQTYDFVERTNTKLVLNTIKEEQIKL